MGRGVRPPCLLGRPGRYCCCQRLRRRVDAFACFLGDVTFALRHDHLLYRHHGRLSRIDPELLNGKPIFEYSM